MQIALRTIHQHSQTLALSSDEFTAVSRQMKNNAHNSSGLATVVSAAADEVSKNVHTAAAAVEEMSASINEIAKHAGEAAQVANQAVEMTRSTNVTVLRLGDSSLEIGKIVKVINNIAQQTNLLSLNAAIEAAKAGDSGRGFAVVAKEVKDLAKETAKATDDIGRMVDAIQHDSRGAVDAINGISQVIGQINTIQMSIASSVNEQSATTNEIGRNVFEAAKGATEIARSIAQVADEVEHTDLGAADIERASEDLARVATSLHAMVSQFRCGQESYREDEDAGIQETKMPRGKKRNRLITDSTNLAGSHPTLM